MLHQMMKRILCFLLMLLTFLIVSPGCGVGRSISDYELIQPAKTAFHDWATRQDIPYEILDTKVSVSDSTWGTVDIVALIKDLHVGASRTRYVQVAVRLQKYGDEWRAETPLSIEDVFAIEVLSTEDRDADQCDSILTRSPSMYPCLRITNRSFLSIRGYLQVTLGRCLFGRQKLLLGLRQNQHTDIVLPKTFFENASCGDDWQEWVFVDLVTEDHLPVVFYGSIIDSDQPLFVGENGLTLIAYGYEVKDVGDGWNIGTLHLAFENVSDVMLPLDSPPRSMGLYNLTMAH